MSRIVTHTLKPRSNTNCLAKHDLAPNTRTACDVKRLDIVGKLKTDVVAQHALVARALAMLRDCIL